jgi:hypothetical protein
MITGAGWAGAAGLSAADEVPFFVGAFSQILPLLCGAGSSILLNFCLCFFSS